jgi:hypothetical protein
MLNEITSTIFNAMAVAVAIAVAVWLAIAGYAWQVEGLMLAMGAMLGAIVFAFRVSESAASGRLSIWAGPLSLR